MTWSAEAAAQFFRHRQSHFRLSCLVPSRDGVEALPGVASLIGVRRFLRCVDRSGLSRSFPAFRPWVKIALWAGALLVTVLLKLLDIEISDRLTQAGGWGVAADAALLFLPFAALTVGMQELIARATAQPSSDAVRELRQRLEEAAAERRDPFWVLVGEIARDLERGPFPRALVIDDFERLDLVTREALVLYMERHAARGGSEFWVVFESMTGDRLSRREPRDPASVGFAGLRVFDQEPLGAVERRELAQRIGKPERGRFTTVKAICEADPGSQEPYVGILLEHRQKHPAPQQGRYDDVDLLHLLWLNAAKWHETFEVSWVASGRGLSSKSGLRQEILRSALPGTALRMEEFDRALGRLRESLAGTVLLTAEERPGTVRFTLHGDLGATLEQGRERLRLAADGLGHAFWAVFWYDRLLNRPLEAFWIRKLAAHLCAGDLTGIEDEGLYLQALKRTAEALAYALRGALRTCVYDHLPELLRRAAKVAQEDLLAGESTLLARLRDACWEAFGLTGSQEALASYLRLLERTDEPEPGEPAGDPDLTRLFLESLPLEGDARRALGRALAAAARRSEAEQTLSESAALRACALALCCSELTSLLPEVDLLNRAAGSAARTLPATLENLNRRLVGLDTDAVLATDLIDLNLAIWALVELLDPRQFPTLVDAGRLFALLVDSTENAVLFAGVLWGRLDGDPGRDLVRTAQARELCVTAVAASVVCARRLGAEVGSLVTPPLVERIAGVLRTAGEQLHVRLPEVAAAEDLLSAELLAQAVRLLENKAYLWVRFQLPQLGILAQSRRLVLLEAGGGTADPWLDTQGLRNALAEAGDRADLGVLISSLRLARMFRWSAELRADHLLPAAARVLGGDFGPLLRRDFSLLALGAAHHLQLDLDRYVEFLVFEAGEDGRPTLLGVLEKLDADALETMALRLLNAAYRSAAGNGAAAAGGGRKLHGAVGRLLSSELERRASDGERAGTAALLDYFEVKARLDRGELADPAEALAGWQGRKEHWSYAGILWRLLEHGLGDGAVTDEAVAVLARTEPPGDNTAYAFLAMVVADHFRQIGRPLGSEDVAVAFLRSGVEHWQDSLGSSNNVRVFRILLQACPESAGEYGALATYWSKVELEHAEASRLSEMLLRGSYFEVFFYYLRFFLGWGLDVDCGAEILQRWSLPTPERVQEELARWAAAGHRVPAPLVDGDQGPVVSCDFLAWGNLTRHPSLADDPRYADARRRFDRLAAEALPGLLETSASLPGLPEPIGDLVRAYAERFGRFTLPEVMVGA